MIRIFDKRLTDDLFNKLKKKGLFFLVKEKLDKDLKPCRAHFQGVVYGNYSTVRGNIRDAGYKDNKQTGTTMVKDTSEDIKATLHYLCKGTGPNGEVDYRVHLRDFCL